MNARLELKMTTDCDVRRRRSIRSGNLLLETSGEEVPSRTDTLELEYNQMYCGFDIIPR